MTSPALSRATFAMQDYGYESRIEARMSRRGISHEFAHA